MKGIVFTEFLELVETRMGLEMVDRIITDAQLSNNGAYTAVGTYDHSELVRLVSALNRASGIPVPDLIRLFGEHLFHRFSLNYPSLFVMTTNTFDFLCKIENYIHVEVRKLYPDAELPKLNCNRPTPKDLILIYSSPRGFGDLAEGLIHGCIAHFKEAIKVERTALPTVDGNQCVRFHLVKESI